MNDKKNDKNYKKEDEEKFKNLSELPYLSKYAKGYIEFTNWIRNKPPVKEK